MKDDVKTCLKAGVKYVTLSNRFAVHSAAASVACAIMKGYMKLSARFIKRPRLFRFFALRWCAWANRALEHMAKCKVLKPLILGEGEVMFDVMARYDL